MKCPKCGYLGFETTDRCRNCQYDFSLAPFLPEQELPLHGADRKNESPHDFELPPIARQGEAQVTPLDLDRLFGESAPSSSALQPTLVDRQPAPPDMKAKAEERAADPPIMMALDGESRETEEFAAPSDAFTLDEGALPFDDAPIMAPPAARTPLAVRRSTPEVARNRARGPRPNRPEPLDFELTLPKSDIASRAAIETVASLMEAPSLGARVGAGLIDLLLLVGIDAAILYLTLRITGLQATLDDVRVLPVIPFVGFLVVLGYGYLAAFTVAGGQTIGKMILSLRVIGDDGRPVDTAGGMLRALACLLIPITLGLSYLPAIFTSDHRALHDRLAGTRVVQE
jgi:uncharacterized RDD family membrane protein YckC